MVKIVLIVIYLLIGLFFMGQTLAIADKAKNEEGEGPHAIAILIVSILELFAWPAMIALTAGFTIGKKKDD